MREIVSPLDGFSSPFGPRRGSFNPASLFSAAGTTGWVYPEEPGTTAWRRNLLTRTEEFDNAAWVPPSGSVTFGSEVSGPFGSPVKKWVEQNATGFHRRSQTITGLTTATFFVVAKAAERSWIGIWQNGAAAGWPNNTSRVSFNLSSGSLGTVGSGWSNAFITHLGDGWYLCGASAGGGTGGFQASIGIQEGDNVNSYAGNGSSGLYVAAAQLEPGSTATNYQRITDVNTEIIANSPGLTLFQDATGTIPVVNPGDPVGLSLDTSKGLVLGPELVTNGTFDTDLSGWSSGNSATISLSAQKMRISFDVTFGYAYAEVATEVGKFYTYALESSFVSGTNGGLYLQKSDAPTVAVNAVGTSADAGPAGDKSLIFVATATTTYIRIINSGTLRVFDVDNISVKELPGVHAFQTTALNRPIYGRHPVTGIRNLLDQTENFSVWNVAFQNNALAPVVTATANPAEWRVVFETTGTASTDRSRLRRVSVGGPEATVWAVDIRSNDSASYQLALLIGNANLTNITVTPTWQRFVCTAAANTSLPEIRLTGNSTSGTLADVVVRFPQFERGTVSTAYQRVTTAFDVTEAGVASVNYLSHNGTNQWLTTSSFAWGSDKATITAGVRKLSDAAAGIVAEIATGTQNGLWSLGVSQSAGANYSWYSKGTALVGQPTASSYAAPITNVLTGLGDINGDVAALRINGAQIFSLTSDQGTGNFGTYPLFFGARNGTSLFFNGRRYPSVGINTLLSGAQLAQVEAWVTARTGALG
jgi:hypothetical protein